MKFLVLFSGLMLIAMCSWASHADTLSPPKNRINIVISTKAKSPDPALMSFHAQTWWNQLFHRKHFRFIIAYTIEEAVERVKKILDKEKALIGNIWFDSHGHMGRRITILEVGDVELNYQTIKEPWIREKISAIGAYSDSLSKVCIGSCYSSAGYMSAGSDSFPSRRMNGDSLMMDMSTIFNGAEVYGSVSWITTKMGIYSSAHATAGNPWAKRFKDPRFMPAWDSLGVWKLYNPATGWKTINTVSMDHKANIVVASKPFLDIPRFKKHQQKKIRKLKKGNFPDEYFYRYKDPLHIANGRK